MKPPKLPEPRTWLVYKLTSPSGKIYVGQTKWTADYRFWVHCQDAKRADPEESCALYAAILKYGKKAFVVEVLEEGLVSRELAGERETYWIALLQSHKADLGYNETLGGEGVWKEFCKAGHRFEDVGYGPNHGCGQCYKDRLAALKLKRETDPEWKAQQNEKARERKQKRYPQIKERMTNDAEFRSKSLAYMKSWREAKMQDPEYRERERQRCIKKNRRKRQAHKIGI